MVHCITEQVMLLFLISHIVPLSSLKGNEKKKDFNTEEGKTHFRFIRFYYFDYIYLFLLKYFPYPFSGTFQN